VRVEAVVDPRAQVPGSIEAAAKAAEARLIAGGAVTRAHGALCRPSISARQTGIRSGSIAISCVSGWSPTPH
jgi:hypothetical protein